MQTHVVLKSSNRKLGKMAATYRTQDSCPRSCPLLDNGCYATGRIFSIPKRFGSDDYAPLRDLVDTLPENGALRLNVSGDVLLSDGSPDHDYIDAANFVAERRPDVTIWSYTHAWRTLTPGMFRFVVNASCETIEDVLEAQALGWQTVIVDDGSITGSKIDDRNVISCPAETRDVTCDDCRACGADTRTRPVISFNIHGATRAKARATIERVRA